MTTRFRSAPLAFALVAGTLLATPVSALEEKDFNYDSTENLYRICATEPSSDLHLVASLTCRAFLEATVQYHDAVTSREGLKPLVCYPKGATIEDARQAFVAWGNANSGNTELMNEPPVKGVVRALAAKYPCRK